MSIIFFFFLYSANVNIKVCAVGKSHLKSCTVIPTQRRILPHIYVYVDLPEEKICTEYRFLSNLDVDITSVSHLVIGSHSLDECRKIKFTLSL